MRRTIRLRALAVFSLVGLIAVAFLSAKLQPNGASSRLMARVIRSGDNPAALLQINTSDQNPFEDGPRDQVEVDRNLRTTLQLITSPNVVTAAASTPQVAALPFVAKAKDAGDALRDHLIVRVLDDSNLIEIASRDLDRRVGAIVVNAVVNAFLDNHAQWTEARSRTAIRRLEAYRDEIERRIEAASDELDSSTRIALEPGGEPVGRSVVEADLLDCVRHLRRIRLDRAALRARLDDLLQPGVEAREEDARGMRSVRIDLEAIARQEAHLVEERDRMVASLARSDEAIASDASRRARLEHLIEQRKTVEDRIARLYFESQGDAPITLIAKAEP